MCHSDNTLMTLFLVLVDVVASLLISLQTLTSTPIRSSPASNISMKLLATNVITPVVAQ
jgi:hypothetical protein